MKKMLTMALLFVMSLIPNTMKAQSYSQLWKQVEEAQSKDLPKTQIDILDKIIRKARKEQMYGHLLKAQLSRADAQIAISPDSLQPEADRLKEAEQRAAADPVLAAVYQSVLGHLYTWSSDLGDDHETIGKGYYKQSMSHPDLLAAQPCSGYEPMVVTGSDSRIFNNDLLHVIGMEAKDYQTLHDYYEKAGMREATCLCALYLSDQHFGYNMTAPARMQDLDSLLTVYADLPVCGEVAIRRFTMMQNDDRSTEKEQVAFIDEALTKWKSWPRINELRNARLWLTQPTFTLRVGDYVSLPGQSRTIRLEQLRNLSSMTIALKRLNITGLNTLNPNDERDWKQLQKLIVDDNSGQTHILNFTEREDMEQFSDSVVLQGLSCGVYLIEASATPRHSPAEARGRSIDTGRALLHVSNLTAISEILPEKTIRIVVVNATTGRPMSGASVRLRSSANYQKKEGSVWQLTSDGNGEVIFTDKEQRPDYIYISTANDTGCPEYSLTGGFSFNDNKRDQTEIKLYTDRSIYRPGQTVHVALLAVKTLHREDAEVISGQQFTLVLRDANNKVVKEQTVTTDSYGMGSVDFVLPASGLTGSYSILTTEKGGRATFSVEEYKRPTFQVEFEKVTQPYANGDTVVVKALARSFAGVPVQGAKVRYNIWRRSAFRWYHRNEADNKLDSKETTTDADGTFTVHVPIVLPEGKNNKYFFYSFDVEADVTDQSGESHSGEIRLPLSSKSTAFSLEMPKQIQSDSICRLLFHYTNNAGEAIPGQVRYDVRETRKQGVKGLKGVLADANKSVELPMKKLRSGHYLLTAVCGTDTVQQEFTVFSMKDKRPALETDDWFFVSAKEFPTDGSPVYVQMGASYEQQHIVYTIVSGGKVLESSFIDQSNAITTRTFTYKEEYGDGIVLTCAWVHNGETYTHQARIVKPLPDKRLKLHWTTFRDRLTPGQEEEWTLRITHVDGTPARGHLLAVLYDKSLDEIHPHKWNLSLPFSRSLPSLQWKGRYHREQSLYGSQDFDNRTVRVLELSHLDDALMRWTSQGRFRRYNELLSEGSSIKVRGTGLKEVPVMMAKSNAVYQTVDMSDEALQGRIAGLDFVDSFGSGKSSSQLRENLSETAFFYPSLLSDSEGNISLRFTLPESITTWRFMGLAHDQEVRYGQIEAEAVAKKDVMVQPNMPRFLRQGDKTVISAKLFNSTEESRTGTARLTLLDPATGKTLCEQSSPFEVEASQTAVISFPIDLSSEAAGGLSLQPDLYVCLITAEGEGYSDGERHYLPVLPDKELVTTTYPFTLNGPGNYTKTIENSSSEAAKEDVRLTMEYTANPAWLMIQALPTVAKTSDKNAVSLAAAYYANSIASDIMNSTPDIKHVVEQWNKEQTAPLPSLEGGAGGRLLQSSLEKNQELKSLLLDETPWVTEAGNEEEQKRLLINFFDENALNSKLSTLNEQLSQLQNEDGSFSWWPGMPGNNYITTCVAEMFARLIVMTDGDDNVDNILSRAVEFLTKRTHEEVEELKKLEKKKVKDLRPSELAIDYLYIRTLLSDADDELAPLASQDKEDIQYLTTLLAKQTKALSIYGKARSALILAHNKQTKKAAEYLQSLKEYTVYTEEMGRYFDTKKALYSWRDYRIPTEVAAIEAIRKLQPNDQKTVDEMKRWLLQEKRTQMWDTPVNTVNAVYAFLKDEGLGMKKEGVKMKVNGQALSLPQATAGLGYVKTSMTTNLPQTISVEKSSKGTSWGALYVQQLLPISDIDASSSGISVKREVLCTEKGLAVGSRVKVRITITAERDFDFVQVVDKRAACLEPVGQLSGYRWGYYCTPRDYTTNYYFDQLSKGKHVIETEYYIDRAGTYQSGSCTVQCAYAPEYSGREKPILLKAE